MYRVEINAVSKSGASLGWNGGFTPFTKRETAGDAARYWAKQWIQKYGEDERLWAISLRISRVGCDPLTVLHYVEGKWLLLHGAGVHGLATKR